MPMQRRFAGIILILAGLVLVVEPFADKLFTRTEKFEQVTADFRPVMSREAIAAFRQQVQTMAALPAALQENLLPAIALQAKMTPEQLQELVLTRYPAVVNGMVAVGPLSTQLTQILDTMEAQLADFRKTDAIPTATRSTESIPWAFLIAGIVALLAGVAAFSAGRIVPAVAIVLGVLLVAFPLVTSMTTKAPAADRLNASNRTLITQANADSLAQAVSSLTALGTEFQTKMIPELSAQFRIPAATLLANPLVQSLTTTLPQGLQRLQSTAALIDRNVPRYQAISPVSFVRVTWVAIGSGIALVAGGIIGLAYTGRAASTMEDRLRSAASKKAVA